MKSIFLFMFSLLALNNVDAQKVLGTYEQNSLVAPDAYRDSEHDVAITKDIKSSKKIWVEHLIPNQKFYAILYVQSDDAVIYTVPSQKVGNYVIEQGCVTFKNEHDEDEHDIQIALNNKSMCLGISQKDYDTPISVDENGVKAGGVKVGSDGQVKGAGVDIKNGGVNVDTKSIMAGIQYVGDKSGSKKPQEKD